MAFTLQGSSPQLQGSSVGNQATSPQNNIKPLNNNLPASQVAPNYSNYINKNGTIYNTKGPTSNTTAEGGYATPDALAADLGISKSAIDWSKITSNPNYASSFGQPAPAPTPSTSNISTPNGLTANPNVAPTYNNNLTADPTKTPIYTPTNNTPSPTPTPTPNTNTNTSSATSTGNYGMNIPNGGTTGVSQGGTIGDLIKAVEDPNNPINADISKYTGQIADLNTQNAQQTANIEGTPGIDLSLAGGREGILNRLFAAKNAALQSALNTAVTNRGQVIQGLTNAGQLNAPIVTQPGAAILNPSSNTTVGGTTSGASNLSSLIGVGNGQNGHPQGEYFVTSAVGGMQANQGFSSPQQLADFVNQQQPGAGATAQNVFDLLKSGALNSGGGNIVGVNGDLINSYANMVLSGQANQIPSSVTGNIALWNQVLQKAQQLNPNLNLNQINAQVGANTQIYGSNLDKATTLNNTLQNIKNLGNLTVQNGIDNNINPFSSQYANYTVAQMRSQFSSSGQLTFDSNVNQLKSAINSLYASGGTPTQQSQISDALANPNLSMSGLQALVNAAESEGAILLKTAQGTSSSAYTNINVGGNSTAVQNWGWSG